MGVYPRGAIIQEMASIGDLGKHIYSTAVSTGTGWASYPKITVSKGSLSD